MVFVNKLLFNKTPPYIRVGLRERQQNVVVREGDESRLQEQNWRLSGWEKQCRCSDEFDNLS